MPRKMSRKSGYVQPEGDHLVRVLSIVDLGTQENTYGGKDVKTEPIIKVTFEFCEDVREFERKDGTKIEGPSVATFDFTQKLSTRSKFYKLCKACVGVKKVDDEENFDPDDILGAYCMLEVTHQVAKSSGNVYLKLQDIYKASKDDINEAPKSENETWSFWLDEDADWDRFDKMPEWLQDKIMESPEYEELSEDKSEPEPEPEDEAPAKRSNTNEEEDDDELPWDKEDDEEEKPKRSRTAML